MGVIERAIIEGTIHPRFYEYMFKYAATQNLYVEEFGPIRHRILFRKPGQSKWVFLGDERGAFEYASEAAAKADLKAIREWAKHYQPLPPECCTGGA